MGKYTFTWEHSAHQVYVTGDFDDWRKTVQLDKEDGIFKKTVELPKVKTQYKFVVNGNWCTNDSARKEDDGRGFINNVLLPEDIIDEPVNTMSSAAPESTTAALAGNAPLENNTSRPKHDSPPGAFPETPYAETPGSEPQTFNIAPIPATSGLGNPIKLAPGEPVPDASTLTDNTVHSTVRHDRDLDQEASSFGVAPLPATAGAGNPIHLAPGEKVPEPSTFTSNTIDTTVKTDPASYEKSDALPPLSFTPQSEREANGGMFGLPPVMGNMIPESSLPMGVGSKIEQDTGYVIQSAAPTSTTAALAAQVPKEPRGVPEAVVHSQREAGADPEATTNSEAVSEKKEMEQELRETVPEVPATAERLPGVPAPVVDSQHEAGVASQAIDNPEAVQEKKTVEQELRETVPEAPAAADNSIASQIGDNIEAAAATAAIGATAGAGLIAGAIYSAKDKAADSWANSTTTTDDIAGAIYSAKDKAADSLGLSNSTTTADDIAGAIYSAKDKAADSVGLGNSTTTADEVPNVVAESQNVGHASPEASANPAAVAEKSAMERELLSEVPKASQFGEHAPATAVPAVVSGSLGIAHASPEAATNPEAVAEKSAMEQELLSEVPKTRETGLPAPAIAIPAVVSESQKEAHASPEAAASPEVVAEKKAMESELLSEVPKANESGLPAPAISAATSTTAPAPLAETVSRDVPDVVAESQHEAHASPEASANSEAVAEKSAMESELLEKLPKTNESGEPAPVLTAATTATAPGANAGSVAHDVPGVVAESQKEAHASPEAAANSEAVQEKRAMETELLQEVKSTDATGEPAHSAAAPMGTQDAAGLSEDALVDSKPLKSSSEPDGLNAPASEPAQLPLSKPIDSSTNVTFAKQEPTTTEQTAPTVTTGVDSGTTEATTSAPAAPSSSTPERPVRTDRMDSDVSPKGTPGSQSIASGATDDKKKKRRSIFGKIKDKLTGKDKQ